MGAAWQVSGGDGDIGLQCGEAEMSYHAHARLPHFHPVRTPAGRLISLATPHDHPWHVGLYFAWKYVDGVNCWEDGDGGAEGGPVGAEVLPDGSAVLRQSLAWGGPQGRPLREDRSVIVRPPDGGSFAVDWQATFTAEAAVTLERTPPPPEVSWGGYAGLSLRLPRAFYSADVLDAAGRRGAPQVHGQDSAWCACAGRVDGEVGGTCGAAFIEHPANPRFPGRSFALTAGTIQFLQRAVLWDGPLHVAAGSPLSLRYRVLIYDGEPEAATLDAAARTLATL